MKKIISVLLSAVLILSLSVSAFASFSSADVIFDAAQTIDTYEYADVVELYETVREKYSIDIVYAAYNESYGTTAQAADMVYENFGCGYGETKDGMMLYINNYNNEYIVRLYGRAAELINLDDVYGGIDPFFTSEYTYTDIALAFGHSCDLLLEEVISGTPMGEDNPAENETPVIPEVPAATDSQGFENLPVFDDAQILTDEEYSDILNALEATRTKFSTDVAFVTSAELVSADAQASADDIFDYAGYGYGADKEGILFYVSTDERKYALSTHGDKTIAAFTDDALGYIEEKIMPYLSDSDYVGAAKAYATACDELLQMAADGKPYEAPKSAFSIIITYVIAIAIAAVIAFILMKNKLSQMKTATAKKEANDYVKPGSMNITFANDIFLYSNVIRTEKPKQNSSSTHTSSSGETHGGSSGSF